MAREVKGRWTDVISPEFNAVVVHASLLPNRQVLYWGRRPNPKAVPAEDLNPHFTKAYVWNPPTWVAPPWDPSLKKFGESKSNPISGQSIPTANEPLPLTWDGKDKEREKVNLFCSGHCFLPDGKLLVVGGHFKDAVGIEQACTYDFQTNKFKASIPMAKGRWYPSALPLPDGRVLVLSGSKTGYGATEINNIPEIWPPDISTPNKWTEVTEPFPEHKIVFPLYPRVHLNGDGKIFMVGPLAETWVLQFPKDKDGQDIKTPVPIGNETRFFAGKWSPAGIKRTAGPRDYAPSVMYDSGKILYIGGGDGDGGPTTEAEYIDLNAKPLEWKMTNMETKRRQFNATVLPDGTVLVTGGTRAGGFNDLSNNNPVHEAELWNPAKGTWTTMAPENSDRCYHSVALLLPDGRVLSAGGGEYDGADPPNPQRNLTDGQLFEPPYLFKGPRPTIESAPEEINYGKPFPITVGTSDSIKRVSLVRLGSVTHCRNMNQSLMFLEPFTQASSTIMVPAPADENRAPPGYYMLFVLSQQGVPSVASIVRIPPSPAKTSKTSMRVADIAQHTAVAKHVQPTLLEHNERIITEQARPPVVVGLTPICPYGLGGCWGGAHDALQRLSGVDVIRPVPDPADSVAFVYLQQDILPDLDVWRGEFEKATNKGYDMRGIEMTVSGVGIQKQSGANEQLTLAGTSTRPQLILAPFQATSQLKWDMTAKAPRPITDSEAGAYRRLSAMLADHPAGMTVQVTGTLQKHGPNEFSLDVRDFEVQKNAAS